MTRHRVQAVCRRFPCPNATDCKTAPQAVAQSAACLSAGHRRIRRRRVARSRPAAPVLRRRCLEPVTQFTQRTDAGVEVAVRASGSYHRANASPPVTATAPPRLPAAAAGSKRPAICTARQLNLRVSRKVAAPNAGGFAHDDGQRGRGAAHLRQDPRPARPGSPSAGMNGTHLEQPSHIARRA